MNVADLRRSVLALVSMGLVCGVIATVGFNYVIHATSTNAFCSTCHASDATLEWQASAHYKNRAGVVVGCSDCHMPREFIPKMVRKSQAVREVWGYLTGVINTPDKYEAHRLAMAEIEWKRMRADGARECRNCHDPGAMAGSGRVNVAQIHQSALAGRQVCIDCHKGVAHRAPQPPAREAAADR
jgi:cytochrome c-type protein NapC